MPTTIKNSKKMAKSDAFEAIHTSARELRKIGAIDKTMMRSFDTSCLAVSVETKPKQINPSARNK